MVNVFLELDVEDEPHLETSTYSKVLMPVSERLVVHYYPHEKEHRVSPPKGFKKVQDQFTSVAIAGTATAYTIRQDFDTVKAMLTGAGIKVIEPPATPEGKRTLKVEGKEISFPFCP